MLGTTSDADLGCYDNDQLIIWRVAMDRIEKRNLARGGMSESCCRETSSMRQIPRRLALFDVAYFDFPCF